MFLEQWISIIQTVALVITLGVLIKYTIETKKLREATVEQNELSLRPCITIYWENKFLLKNIGHSPALNIRIDDLQIDKFIYRFNKLNLLEPGDKELIQYIKVGKEDPPGTTYQQQYGFRDIANEFALKICYENIENKHYYSIVKLRPLAENVVFINTAKE